MKCLSQLQPWATITASGMKRIETRGFNTRFRGTFLIHASLPNKHAIELAMQPYFFAAIGGIKGAYELLTGAIIGMANLYDTLRTELIQDYVRNWKSPLNDLMDSGVKDWQQELAFGDYSPGRYGWFLKDAVLFKSPILCKGALSFWELPKELEVQVHEQIKLANEKEATL